MALKEQDVVFTTKDANGNTVIQMPITRVENVEGAVKTVNGAGPNASGNVSFPDMSAATADAAGSAGLVPAPAAGSQGKYLRGDGTWQTPPDTKYTHPNSGVAAGTYNNVTVNAQGHVTAGESVDYLTEASNNPVGTVITMAANSAPNGYLLCNGAAVSRTTYAALFAKIGTTYGSGDGSTTFNLPDSIDRFIQGSGTAGTVKNAGLPNITGTFQTLYPGTPITGAFYGSSGTSNGDGGNGNTKGVTLDASRSSAIYGASTTVQPPALTMRYYIKY